MQATRVAGAVAASQPQNLTQVVHLLQQLTRTPPASLGIGCVQRASGIRNYLRKFERTQSAADAQQQLLAVVQLLCTALKGLLQHAISTWQQQQQHAEPGSSNSSSNAAGGTAAAVPVAVQQITFATDVAVDLFSAMGSCTMALEASQSQQRVASMFKETGGYYVGG
jgi:hypothetical protein